MTLLSHIVIMHNFWVLMVLRGLVGQWAE